MSGATAEVVVGMGTVALLVGLLVFIIWRVTR